MKFNHMVPHSLVKICLLIIWLFMLPSIAFAISNNTGNFVIIPLGVNGGILEENLSAYLLATKNSQDFVLLDAGTVMSGLMQPATQKSMNQLGIKSNSSFELASNMLKNHIRAYLISHAHLDHIAGLVLASPDDSKKDIFGTDETLSNLKKYIFNWKIWPNFADEGEAPLLKQYHYVLLPTAQSIPINHTSLTVEAMRLSHGNNYSSTAFLIRSGEAHLLYFGDTGADVLEKSHDIEMIWKKIAPLIQSGKLKAIFIEASYTNQRADALLFGHLNPKWLLLELNQLANLINPTKPELALKDFPIVVTHIKPGLENGKPIATIITQELNNTNTLGIRFIIPKQGELLRF